MLAPSHASLALDWPRLAPRYKLPIDICAAAGSANAAAVMPKSATTDLPSMSPPPVGLGGVASESQIGGSKSEAKWRAETAAAVSFAQQNPGSEAPERADPEHVD